MKVLKYNDYILENKKEDSESEMEKELNWYDSTVEKTAIGFVKAASFLGVFVPKVAKKFGLHLILLIFMTYGVPKGIDFIQKRNLELPKNLIEEVKRENCHEVKKGDTFYRIAKDNNLTVKEMERMNPNVNPREIKPGDILVVKK